MIDWKEIAWQLALELAKERFKMFNVITQEAIEEKAEEIFAEYIEKYKNNEWNKS